MKNRLISLGLIAVMALSMVACGKEKTEETQTKKTEKTEETKQADIEYNVDDYVTLGDYKGIEVTIEGEYEYTDEGFDKYVQNTIDQAALFVEDSSKTEVEEDSIVNVDYVGSQDGVAFDGGSAEDQTIDVKNNCSAGSTNGFIPGFTEGLVGHKVGEEVAYDVTFPESYGNTDLAGKTVVFTFQVNYIAKQVTSKKQLTDEIVSSKFGYETVDAYMDALKKQYESTLESNRKSDTETAVMNAIINNSTVKEIPEGLLQARVDMILAIQEKKYEAYGTTMKDYLASVGQDYDEVVASLSDNIKESVETELILEAIAKKENITVDEAGYKEFLDKILQNMGYTDTEKFYADYSVDGYDGEKYFKLAYVTEKATDFCVENAVVNATNTIGDVAE